MSSMPGFCTIGSAADRLVIVSPVASMSTQGEMHQPQPGCGSPASRIATLQPRRARRQRCRLQSQSGLASRCGPTGSDTGNGILDCCRKGMLGRKPIVERQGPALGSTAGFGHEMAMAIERPNHIAAAV